MSEAKTANGAQEASGVQRTLVKTLRTSREFPKLMGWYLIKAKLANILHKKTAWATAGFPIELLWGFDIFPLHPENNACVAGARHMSQELIEYAESLGMARELCSYMKTNIGAYDKKIGLAYGGISKPTFVACTGTICDTHVKWFQTQARRMNVPIFVFDIPHYVSGSDDKVMDRYIDYINDQVYDYFDFIYDVTGRKFNEKKFFDVLKKSDRLAELWQEIYNYRKLTPAPLGYADTLSDIFPLVVLPGIDKGIKFYENLLADVKEQVELKRGVVPEEKFRILFEGIPFWYRIKFFHQLANYGAVVTYEPYTYSFGPRKTLGLSKEQTIRELSKLMVHFPYNYNLETRIKYFEQTIDDYRIDGVILHANQSCRPSATGMIDLKNAIQKDKNIPVLLLDCDMNDPRAFSEAPMQNRLESFIELLNQNKK
jgi:benzoyl-CoA reductase/2-hydroxyglutaryl-CoA dehydratase subunit BcrC/BadD/HgdB